jgi:hypothetical protein
MLVEEADDLIVVRDPEVDVAGRLGAPPGCAPERPLLLLELPVLLLPPPAWPPSPPLSAPLFGVVIERFPARPQLSGRGPERATVAGKTQIAAKHALLIAPLSGTSITERE